ncbi:MAG: hypothetical protein N3E51_03095 [Candidatus Micrarchaeota archaeon]|nr:hypothetical protein [Candidatus Micrarchaeota archaeon]
MKKDEAYKSVGEGSGRQPIEEIRNEIVAPLERDIEKLRDPIVLAALMHTAATEKENTNRLLKTLIEKLDQKFSEIEARLSALEAGGLQAAQQDEILLPEVDEQILAFVKERRFASAEEVRRRFGYKGKNAASARLNRMFELGLLEKRQVGRAVLYSAAKTMR